MRGQTWLVVLSIASLLTGCAVSAPAPSSFVLTSLVPIEGFDRTDMQCYYGIVW